MEKYQDSLLTKFNYDEHGNPISVSMVETQTITKKGLVQLVQFPDEFQRVRVQNDEGNYLYETQNAYEIGENQYYVNYANGIVYFNPNQVGKSFKFTYAGRGVELISTSRIFHKYTEDGDEVVQTITDILDNTLETTENLLEEEKTRQENEKNRIERFNAQMEQIQQEIFDKDSEFQTQLSRQEETFQTAKAEWNEAIETIIETVQATDQQLHENEQQRQAEFDTKLEEVEAKILSNESEFNSQQADFESRFTQKLEEVDHRTTGQLNDQQHTFDNKLLEWEGELGQLIGIDDQTVEVAKTWSSQKIQEELTEVDAKIQATNVVVEQLGSDQQALSGEVERNKGAIETLNLNLQETERTLQTKVDLTSVSADALANSIVKRTSTGGINVSNVSINGATPWTNTSLPVEKGKWTPRVSIKNSSYVSQATITESYGQYQRIGKMVYLTGSVSFSTRDVGEIIITGMPLIPATGEIAIGSLVKYTKNLPANTVAYARVYSDGYLKVATQNYADAFSFKTLSTVSQGSGVDITGGLFFSIWYSI